MRLLDRHIFRELLGPFLFGVAAFTSIMFAGKELFNITELLAEFHAPLGTAVQLVFLFMPSLIVMTLPMAMLLSALLGFGRLSADSESIALFASGISLYRLAIPVAVLAVVVTALSFVLSEVVAPATNSRHEMIVQKLKGAPASRSKTVLFADVEDGVTNAVVYVQGGVDPQTNRLYDVAVIQYYRNKPALFICGEEAEYDEQSRKWSFARGYSRSLVTGMMTSFAGLSTRKVEIEKTPEEILRYQKKHDQLSFSQLNGYIRMLQDEGQDVNELRVRMYQKIALPLATLVFALIGIPLGLRPQRSSSAMGLGLSIVIIFSYWVLMHYMTILGKNGALSPAAASFIPTLAGIAVGIALIVRAAK